MNEILNAIAFAATDEVRVYPDKPNISDFYDHSDRCTAIYERFTGEIDALEITPDEHDELIDMVEELTEAYREEAFSNGFTFAVKLLGETSSKT